MLPFLIKVSVSHILLFDVPKALCVGASVSTSFLFMAGSCSTL